MRKAFTYLFLSLLTICSDYSASAQWQKSGPDGGIVYNTVINGSEWLCLTNAGVFKSTDNGDLWTDVSAGLPTATLLSIIRQGNQYMVSTSLGVYTSSDGNTWTKTAANSLRLIYADASEVYGLGWPSAYNSIYNSTNGGTSFEAKTLNSPREAMTSNGTTLFAASGSSVVYYNGSSWDGSLGSGIGAISDLKYFSGQGLVAATENGIYRHSDNTMDYNPWTKVSTGLTASYGFSCLASVNNNYYAVGRNYVGGNNNGMYTIYTSTDLNTWTIASTTFYKSKIYALKSSGNDLIACTSHGLFVSSDNAQSWTLKMTGVKANYVTDITGNATTLFVATSNTDFMTSNSARYHYGGALFKSSDNGQSWTKTGLPDSIGLRDILVVNNTIFAVGLSYNSYSRMLFRSLDEGNTWQLLISDTEDPVSLLYHNNNLYVATSYGIKKSTDSGDNWTDLSTGDFRTGSTYCLESTTNDIYISNDYYFTVAGGGIFKSSDNGVSWSIANNNYYMGFQSSGPISKLGSDGNVLYASIFHYFYGNLTEYYRSTDNGLSWQQYTAAMPPQKVKTYYSWEGNTYMGTGLDGAYFGSPGLLSDSGSVFVTSDKGVTWQDISTDLPEITVNTLYVHGGKLLAGTFGGFYMRDAISGSISEPVPLSSFGSNTNVQFSWSVENVNNIVLEYSENGGTTWNTIVNNLPSNNAKIAAITGQYTWTAPTISASQIIVRLKDYDSGIELNRNTYNISSGTTSLTDPRLFNLKVYPNPSHGIFMIEGEGQYVVEVRNALGEKVYSGLVEGNQLLDLSTKSRGIYSCRFISGGKSSSLKLIIE